MYDGIINVYKEKGFTSHDVVAKMRGILGQRKIGHTGTLDPAAEGVLPVCAGKGTKLCDMLTDHDKTYRAVLLLGTVSCSKGTYIRTLCHDIGAKLSVGGCMKELLRTKVGRFELSESLTLDELQKLKEEDRLAEAVLPVEEVFKELPEIRSDTEELDKLLKNGNPFRSRAVKDVKGGDMFRVYHSDGTFIGVFKYDEEKHMYYPEKIFLGGN